MKSQPQAGSILAIASLILFLLLGEAGVHGKRNSFQSSPQQGRSKQTSQIAPEKRAQIAEAFGKLPLQFEENRGQASDEVKFISRSGGQTLFLTANEAVMKLRPGDSGNDKGHFATVKMKLAGANRRSRVAGLGRLPGSSNYFIGNKPERWRTNVANYGRVQYDQVYPGIDLVWHGSERQLEHDFIVAPGADPKRIKLSFSGVRKLSIDNEGALVLQTAAGDLKLLKPQAWQEREGQKRKVTCDYVINPQHQIEFGLGRYDPQFELVIDPILLYSTYLGGRNFEEGVAVAHDKDGNIYLAGNTFSSDFPGYYQPTSQFGKDVFVMKLNPGGSAILYHTLLGGDAGALSTALAVDQTGNAYVTGSTSSPDFPVTNSALQKIHGGGADSFLTKINATGSTLIYSTFLGGSGGDFASGIALDGVGNAYLAGSSSSMNLPTTGFQVTLSSSGAFRTDDRATTWTDIGARLNSTYVKCLAAAPTNPVTLYAGTDKGIFKSIDGGNEWLMTGRGSSTDSPASVQVITVDPINPDMIYVGTQTGGIFKSANGGNSYIKLNPIAVTDTNVLSIFDIIVSLSVPPTIYVGTNDGAYRSTNGGVSWGLMQLPGSPNFTTRSWINQLLLDPTNHSIIYAATSQGAFKTTNGGNLWVAINIGPALITGVHSLAIDPTTPNILYAGLFSDEGGVFKTTDAGTTWKVSGAGLSLPGERFPLTATRLIVDPTAPHTIYAGTDGGGVYKTTDGGANWSASNSGMPAQTINALVLDPHRPANLYVGVSGGTDAFAAKINVQGSALEWLTYLGGLANDDANGIALDKSGNVYLAGFTSSRDFPTANPLQAANAGRTDAYVAKLNPTGKTLIYSTYLGGLYFDRAQSIAVNNAGQVYLTGSTSSPNFPLLNALQATFGGYIDAFVTKLNPMGSAIEYSTYLGGEGYEIGNSLTLDGAGNVYLTGCTSSDDFPLLDSIQTRYTGSSDVFVTKIGPTGSSLIYSTYIGGFETDCALCIAVNSFGTAYVVGYTRSSSFPTRTPLQTDLRGIGDAFVLKLGVEPELSITKTVSHNPVFVGKNFDYVLTVGNHGVATATGVTVTDLLPAGINFVSAISSQGSCGFDAGMVTCSLGNLAVNAEATIMLTVMPAAAGTISNTVRVAGNELEGDQTNNQATTKTTISARPSIYGRVTLANGNPLPGVSINLTGAQTANRQTDDRGFYQFAGIQSGGNYNVVPSLDSYSFEPPSRSVPALSADQAADFTATLCAYSFSPSIQDFTMAGGNGTINLTATPRCPWAAAALDNWIVINSGSSGSGSGAITFFVAPTTTPRSGRITVAGRILVVYQGVNACEGLRFTEASYSSAISPSVLEAGDFNADGHLDLVALELGHTFNGGLRLLNGDGSGRFTLTNGPPGGFWGFGMTSADFNGDGRLDLAVVWSPTVKIYLNHGREGLKQSFETPVYGGFNHGIYATDLNRDRKPDLVLINSPYNYFPAPASILLNDGSGGFSAELKVNIDPLSILGVADINGDGNGDLLGYRVSSGTLKTELQIFFGNGFGSFSSAVVTTLDLASQGYFGRSSFGDFNGDGKLDVVIRSITSESSNLQLILGDGAGHFKLTRTIAIDERIDSLVAGDFNSDGKLDVATSSAKKVTLFFGDGGGGLSSAATATMSKSSNSSSSMAAGDFNGDGKLDFATTSNYSSIHYPSSVSVFINRCTTEPGSIISGHVSDQLPQLPQQRSPNVTVRLTGSQTATTQTDGGGNYIFTGLAPGGNYTVSPTRTGFDFNPVSLSFNNLIADQVADFLGVRKLTPVSAATYVGDVVAPDSIVALFGVDLGASTEVAATVPLPIFLAGTRVTIMPNELLRLFFVSPNQINALMPLSPVDQPATISVISARGGDSPVSMSTIRIEKVVPGLFTADASGRGLAAADILRAKADGSLVYEPVTQFDPAQGKIVAVPIDLGNAADEVILLLFGTGFRHHSGLANVTTKVGGETVQTLFAGAHGSFAGLDQINLRLPRSLAGRGLVDIVLMVDGKTANTVQVNIK